RFVLRSEPDCLVRCPALGRTFSALRGTVAALSKSAPRAQAIRCCVDRVRGTAPSSQCFHPSVLVVVLLGRGLLGHRYFLAKRSGPARTPLWQARNPAARNIDSNPAQGWFRASSVGVLARLSRLALLLRSRPRIQE